MLVYKPLFVSKLRILYSDTHRHTGTHNLNQKGRKFPPIIISIN